MAGYFYNPFPKSSSSGGDNALVQYEKKRKKEVEEELEYAQESYADSLAAATADKEDEKERIRKEAENKAKRGFWERQGDKFEANSPQDKAIREARGEPTLYKDQRKQKEETSKAQKEPFERGSKLNWSKEEADTRRDAFARSGVNIDELTSDKIAYEKFKAESKGKSLARLELEGKIPEEAKRFERNQKKAKGAEKDFQKSVKTATGTESLAERTERSLSSGPVMLAKLPGDLAAIGGTALDVAGADQLAEQMYGWGKGEQQKVKQQVIDRGFGQGPDDNILDKIGGAVSSLGTAMVGGSLTGVPKAAIKGKGLIAAVKTYLRPTPITAAFGASTAGDVVVEARDAGKSAGQALTTSLLAGGAETILENFGLGKLFARTGKLVPNILKQGITGGIQEAGQSGSVDLLRKTYTDVPVDGIIQAAVESFFLGAITQGPAGGIMSVANNVSQELESQGVTPEDAAMAGKTVEDSIRDKLVEVGAEAAGPTIPPITETPTAPVEQPTTVIPPATEVKTEVAKESAPQVGKTEIYEYDKNDLKKAGFGIEAMGFGESATVEVIDGKPTVAYSFLDGALAGFSVAKDARKTGVATKWLKEYMEEEGGSFKVIAANDDMLAVLNKIGKVSAPDGTGTITITASPQVGKTEKPKGSLKPLGKKADVSLVYPDTKDLSAEQKEKMPSNETMTLKTVSGRDFVVDRDTAGGGKKLTVLLKKEAIIEAKAKKDKESEAKFRRLKPGDITKEQGDELKLYVLGDQKIEPNWKQDTRPTSSLTPGEVNEVADDGLVWNARQVKELVQTHPKLKDNPVMTYRKDGNDSYLEYKDDNWNTRVKVTALGISEERIAKAGLKDGATVDLSGALKTTNKVPAIQYKDESGKDVIGMEANADAIPFKQRPALPRREVQQRETPKEKITEKQAKEDIIRPEQIVKDMTEKFTPIRRGRMRMRSALGEFHPKDEVIRLRKIIGDATEGSRVGVSAHEVGHYLSKTIPALNTEKKVGLPSLTKEENKLLSSIATKPGNKGSVYQEGLAEFFRYYVVNPEALQEKMPGVYKKIDAILKENPEVRAKLIEVRKQWSGYQGQSAVEKIVAQISYGDKKMSVKDKMSQRLDKMYTNWSNDLYPFAKLEEQAGLSKLSASERPSTLALLSRGLFGNANAFLEYKTFTPGKFKYNESNKKWEPDWNGKGFKEITQKIYEDGSEVEFDAYLVAKRTISLAEQRDIKTGVDVNQAREAVEKLETKYPHFAEAQKELVGYNTRLLQYIKGKGMITAESYNKMLQMNENYVPFYRVMEEAARSGMMGKGYADLNSGIKRITGSEREIVSPLESIVKNTYAFMQAAEMNAVGQAWVKLAESNKMVAQNFERVKNPKAKVATVTLEELGVSTAFKEDAFGGEVELETDEAINIFRPLFRDKSERILTVLVNGKQQFYYVEDPAIYETLLNMNEQHSNVVMNILHYPASWLRAGATLTPDFIARNPIRDQFAAFIYSRTGYIPGYDSTKGLYSAVRKDNDYWMWQMSGGAYSTMVSVDRDYAREHTRNITGGNKMRRSNTKAENAKRLGRHMNPLTPLRNLSELMENATRLGEYKEAIRAHGKISKKEAMHPLEAAMASKEITLNFQEYGVKAREVNRIVAFFNASIRDWVKMNRELVTTKDHKRQAKVAFKAIIAITIPTILLYLMNHDEEWYKETPQWQKDSFFLFRVGGQTIRIPKPFLLGFVFGTIPERVLTTMNKEDPEGFKNFVDSIIGQVPMPIPTGAAPLIETWANRSFFTGGPIDPRGEQDLSPQFRYGTWTSEIAKTLSGNIGGISPRKIDNMVSGYFGGLGKYATQSIDFITNSAGWTDGIPRPSQGWQGLPVIKGLLSREPIGSASESVNRFYAGKERATNANKDIKYFEDLKDQATADAIRAQRPEWELMKHYNKIGDVIGDIRKEITGIERSRDINPGEKKDKITALNRLMTQVAQDALRFDGKYNMTGDVPDPLPGYEDYNTRISDNAEKGEWGKASDLMDDYNKRIDAWLDNIKLPDAVEEEIRDKKFTYSRRSMQSRATYRSKKESDEN